jgi:hypothetical protein
MAFVGDEGDFREPGIDARDLSHDSRAVDHRLPRLHFVLRALVDHDLARERIAGSVQNLGERRARFEAIARAEELSQVLVFGRERRKLLQLRGLGEGLLREARVLRLERTVRREEFGSASHDTERGSCDALQRIDDHRSDLPHRVQILESRVGAEKHQGQYGENKKSGERGRTGPEKRRRLMFH